MVAARRIVITGTGLITALGTGTEKTWSGLLKGQSAVGPVTKFDPSQLSARIAGEVKDFVPEAWGMDRRESRRMDLFAQYAVAASEMAMRESGLPIGTEKPQVGMLQLATVNPQPHWQVKPSETSALVGVSAANVSRETFFSSGERKTNIAAIRKTSDDASTSRTLVASGSAEVGQFACAGGLAAERSCNRGALAHVRPHHDDGADHHHQASRP